MAVYVFIYTDVNTLALCTNKSIPGALVIITDVCCLCGNCAEKRYKK